MKFTHPYLLNFLWGLIPFFGIMVFGMLERKKILSRFADAGMFSSIIPEYDPKRRWIKAVLITLATGCFIVALSGPQWGFKWEKINEKGVDLMIALDCSKSMLAEDIKPNRLERAKREIVDLLRMMKSDRAGLVAFSGKAVLQCPLTLDHEAFYIFLNVLTPGFLPVGGTNLSEALMTAFNGFEKESDTEKAVIIITDGENTAGDAEEAAKMLAKKGIKIFCIGVGDSEGAPIPDDKGGFKKDASGNIVLSRVDEKGLETLAALTGGAYVRSVAGDMDLDLIYKDKIRKGMQEKNLTSGKQKVWENRFQWFLFPGLILFLIESLVGPGKRVLKSFLPVLMLSIIFSGLPLGAAHAGIFFSHVGKGIKAYEAKQYEEAKKQFIGAQLENPDDKRHYYNIGTAAYMNKEYEEALGHFSKVLDAKDVTLRHNALFNHANTQYRLGNMDEAIKEYEDILREFPDDREAKENLDFVKQKKKEEEQKPEPEKNKDRENKKDKDKENKDPENKNQENKDNQGQKQGDKEEKKESRATDGQQQQAKGNLENMLNRLEDKPGSALIPLLQDNAIEKDW